MKPEEAIKKLVALQDGNGDTYEAIRMAIEALTAMESCVLTQFGECSYSETGCSDCEIKEKIRKALEKQTPMSVQSVTDRTWGIEEQQPVCPECDSYLTRTVFIPIDGTEGKKISYCEFCGQAIDWKGGE